MTDQPDRQPPSTPEEALSGRLPPQEPESEHGDAGASSGPVGARVGDPAPIDQRNAANHHQPLRELLGGWVTVTNPSLPAAWTGKLIGLTDQPSLVVEDDRGHRMTLPQSFRVERAAEPGNRNGPEKPPARPVEAANPAPESTATSDAPNGAPGARSADPAGMPSPTGWHYGPTDTDPDPGRMWHYGCGREVFGFDGGYVCDCGRQWDDAPDDTDLSEVDIDRMMAEGEPVQLAPPPSGQRPPWPKSLAAAQGPADLAHNADYYLHGDTTPALAGLRQQYADVEARRAALPEDERLRHEAADAPMLRIQLLHTAERARRAEDELARLYEAESADAATGSHAHRAELGTTPDPADSPALARLKQAAAQASAGAGLLAMRTVRSVHRLRQQWLAAGPPPLGTSVSRWWDARLIELSDVLAEAIDPNLAEAIDTTEETS